jgi:hypothetical protein
MDKINTVKYDINRKMKNVDQKLDLFMKLFEGTMNNMQLITTNILQNQERMLERIENIEKDMRALKNRKTNENIESERTKVHKLMENFHDSNQTLHMVSNPNRYLLKNSNTIYQNMSPHPSTSSLSSSYPIQNYTRAENEDEISLTNSSSYMGTEYDFEENEAQNLENDESMNYKKNILQRTQSLPTTITTTTQISPCPSVIYSNQVSSQPLVQIISNGYKDIKIETFVFEDDFVKKCLEMNSIAGDLRIFKKMYIENINKEFYPIRHIKKKLQYWLDGHMNDDDTNGSYIKNTITKNISILYLKINHIDRYINNDDKFIKNQDHIFKLSDDKYKDRIMKEIIKIINI